jgi:tripartite-type tricarboxylate transporter receptor subunit TctC
VPFAAGGVTDIVARLVTQKLTERLGQQFYIENMGGAGGNLGMGNASKAPGDGYTMLFSSSSFVVNPSLYQRPTYDALKDFIPVTRAGATPNSWIVHPDFPAKTIKELIELIQQNPGKYSVASPGTGTTPSLSIEMLRLSHNLNFVVVPFAGGGPMTVSLMGGHTPIACSAVGNYMAQLKEGRLRALAITDKKRFEPLPDVPTMEEFGIKGQEAETMTGVFVTAGTPQAVVDMLQREIAAIVAIPDIREKLFAVGVDPKGEPSAEFAEYIKNEIAKWRKVIEDAKIDRI